MKIERALKKEVYTLYHMNILLRAANIDSFDGVIFVSSVEELNRLFCVEYSREDYATLLLRLFEQGCTLAIVPDECLGEDSMFWLEAKDLMDMTD